MQAFSDDELPVDADMAAFMAEETSAEKKKSKALVYCLLIKPSLFYSCNSKNP